MTSTEKLPNLTLPEVESILRELGIEMRVDGQWDEEGGELALYFKYKGREYYGDDFFLNTQLVRECRNCKALREFGPGSHFVCSNQTFKEWMAKSRLRSVNLTDSCPHFVEK